MRRLAGFLALTGLISVPAVAGPPYVTDDPTPTDEGHYEVYAFTAGTMTVNGTSGQVGLDLNYGGAKNLQLTMVLPLAYDSPNRGQGAVGFGELELAAKYKFLTQDSFGFDVAVFPRVFLPTSTNAALGDKHPSYFVPLFVQKDWGEWGAFGGGGCTLHRSGNSQDFCQWGLVVTRRVTPELQLGLEVYHQTPDQRGARQTTGVGLGAIYDLTERYHLMASAGPGLQNASTTNQTSWYVALQFTY